MESRSIFSRVKVYPPDTLLELKVLYDNDTSDEKVDITLGAYRTDAGNPWVLPSVIEAEKRLRESPKYNHEYLPIDGSPLFQEMTRILLFGENCTALQEGRIATVQAPGGTGALRLGFELLKVKEAAENVIVYYSKQTWPNHPNIVRHCFGAQAEIKTYRYYDEKKLNLDFDGMICDLKEAPPGAVILLHMCAHNPTGIDPSFEQWKTILEVIRMGQLFPFFDNAYQGFATGDLVADTVPLKLIMEFDNIELLIACSFSKNMGLYNARCGALHVVTTSREMANTVQNTLKGIIRPMYSNPPQEGAAVATLILSDQNLRAQWEAELAEMPARIASMRIKLRHALEKFGAPGDWSHITNQIGMFSYTGLNRDQVLEVRRKHHIFMADTGRMSMSGVNDSNVEYIAKSFADVIKNV